MRIIDILKVETLPKSTTPKLDLELLLAETLRQPRSFLYVHSEYELTKEQETIFQSLYQRRLQGEPMAYILGKKEFWSLELIVNDSVLIPRPDTELLVEIILDKLTGKLVDVADLGTGSGAIALAIAKERPNWHVVATDLSKDALQVAKNNALQLHIPNIEFYYGDWCDALPEVKFDAIVSNPPYIAKDDPHLLQGDVKFEPKVALEAGDGLEAIKKIIAQAKWRLKPRGLLVLEHGYDQNKVVQKLLQKSGYQKIFPYQDLAHLYRAVVAENSIAVKQGAGLSYEH